MTDSLPPQLDPSWRGHIHATLRLGLPLIGSQLAFIGLSVTDTIMLGWLGAAPLAASVLATQLFFVTMIAGSGMANAVSPIVANAVGAGDTRTVRRSVRMAMWGSVFYCMIASWHLWFSEPLFLMLGQEPELARAGQDYLRIAMWSLPIALFHNAMRSYLTALEYAGIVLFATLLGLILNALINYAFIFGNWGAPALGIKGAAVATLGTNIVMFAIMTLYAVAQKDLKDFEVLNRFWQPDWQALGEVFRLGWPISLTLLAEVSLFAFSTIMMGWLGVIVLAAHGIALQVISVIFMIPLGLTFAATVRVGRAVGRKDALGLYRASVTVTVIALIIAVLAALLLVTVPEPLIRLFLDADNPDAQAIIAIGVPLLAVAALFQIVDTLQVIAVGLLRGLKDTKIPMYMAVVSYLVFGLAAAYVLGFPMGFDGVGIWIGLAVGLFVAAILLGGRFMKLMKTAV